MYSDSDYYYYEKNSFNMSQTTINIIIMIILIAVFFFLFNFCSKNYFSNINSPSDNVIDDLKNELAFVKDELLNKNSQEQYKVYIKEEVNNEEKQVYNKEKKQIYNTDFLFNNNFNNNVNNNPDPNISYQNNLVNYNNLLTSEPNVVVQPNVVQPNVVQPNVVQPIAPPIIYDPIENYDRLKLLDPLVDPRGRSSADQIPTPQVAAQLNFPTQGILDRYHRVGLLIAINKHDCKNNRRRNSYENFNGSDADSYEDFGNIETDTYDNYSTDTYEDFGNVEKVVKGKKVNVDSDSSSSDNKNTYDKKTYDKNGSKSKYSDNSSDLQTISSSYNSKFKEKIIPNNVVLDIGDRDNDILELIGKKIAHDWYRYFTSISKGNKIIKINVNNRNRKELYDGDVVYIPILKRHYKVKIDKMDMIEYNPYFF